MNTCRLAENTQRRSTAIGGAQVKQLHALKQPACFNFKIGLGGLDFGRHCRHPTLRLPMRSCISPGTALSPSGVRTFVTFIFAWGRPSILGAVRY